MSVAIANPAMAEPPPETAAQLPEMPTTAAPSPDIALEIPATPLTAAGMGASKEGAKGRGEIQNMDEKLEESLPTPTSPPPSSCLVSPSSTSSSLPISPSSSTTTDTSVASDANHYHLAPTTTFEENNKDLERANGTPSPSVPSSSPDADGDIKHASSTTITITSVSASTSSTPTSSSCTSLPAIIPSSSSASTSTTPSTTNVHDSNGLLSLLRPRAQFNQNLNVKFAPLPELAPRKRKSSTPLGMAARSQLTRRRKVAYHETYHDDGGYEGSNAQRVRRNGHNGPVHTPGEGELEGGAINGEQGSGDMKKKVKKGDATEHAEDGEKVKVKKEKSQKGGDGQPEEGDALVILARKMGKAGKHIWRKMANGGKGEKEGVSGEDEKRVNAQQKDVIESITVSPEDGERDGKEGQEGGADGAWTEEAEVQQQRLQDKRAKDPTQPKATLSSEPPLALPFPKSRGSDENLLPDKASPPTEAEDTEGEEVPAPQKEVEVQDLRLGEMVSVFPATPITVSAS